MTTAREHPSVNMATSFLGAVSSIESGDILPTIDGGQRANKLAISTPPTLDLSGVENYTSLGLVLVTTTGNSKHASGTISTL